MDTKTHLVRVAHRGLRIKGHALWRGGFVKVRKRVRASKKRRSKRGCWLLPLGLCVCLAIVAG